MLGHINCENDICTECEDIIVRTYRGLRETGYSDRDAFISTVRVLELRHPGRDRYYYFHRIGQWLGENPEIKAP